MFVGRLIRTEGRNQRLWGCEEDDTIDLNKENGKETEFASSHNFTFIFNQCNIIYKNN